jgi:hypothetical protein
MLCANDCLGLGPMLNLLISDIGRAARNLLFESKSLDAA